MDRDRRLIAHLDAKFEGIDRRFGEIQEQIRENTTSVDARLEALTSYIDVKFEGVDRRFEEMEGQIHENAANVDRRFDETNEQIRKNRVRIDNTQVVVEALSSKIEAVAEGHLMLDAKLDRFYDEIKVERQLDRGETRSSIKRLGRRVDRLEAAK